MDVDVIPYRPETDIPKKVDELEYFNVILILNNSIKSNFLFTDDELAANTFTNILKEYSHIDLNPALIQTALNAKFFRLENGSVSITNPNIKIT